MKARALFAGRQRLLTIHEGRHEVVTAAARKVLGRPKRCKLAPTSLWEHSHKGLKLAQLAGPTRRLAHLSADAGSQVASAAGKPRHLIRYSNS